MKKEQEEYNLYGKLGEAIVAQAVKDFQEGVKAIAQKKKKDWKSYQLCRFKRMRDSIIFFHSSWYKRLTTIEPETMLKFCKSYCIKYKLEPNVIKMIFKVEGIKRDEKEDGKV